ncbi:MAG: hypothetical protein WC957_00135, partial [Candidatus Neomarinimicrobiota bacterium]
RGTYRTVIVDDINKLLVFDRTIENDTIRAFFNISAKKSRVFPPDSFASEGKWQLIYSVNSNTNTLEPWGVLIYKSLD